MSISSLAAIVLAPIAAVLLSGGVAAADPASQVDAQGEIRSGTMFEIPETVAPQGGCQYWAKSHAGFNGQAQQNFHGGLNRMITNCGG